LVYIHIPDTGADPILDGVSDRPAINLVEYLRASFAWGGFPGYEFSSAPAPPLLEELRAGLLPI
jgi:hypothetical protein